MLCGMHSPADPVEDRRTVPRHLRDTEHGPAPETPGSGARRRDVPVRRWARGLLLLVVSAVALAGGLWLGVGVPLGVTFLSVAAIAAALASLSFRRQ